MITGPLGLLLLCLKTLSFMASLVSRQVGHLCCVGLLCAWTVPQPSKCHRAVEYWQQAGVGWGFGALLS